MSYLSYNKMFVGLIYIILGFLCGNVESNEIKPSITPDPPTIGEGGYIFFEVIDFDVVEGVEYTWTYSIDGTEVCQFTKFQHQFPSMYGHHILYCESGKIGLYDISEKLFHERIVQVFIEFGDQSVELKSRKILVDHIRGEPIDDEITTNHHRIFERNLIRIDFVNVNSITIPFDPQITPTIINLYFCGEKRDCLILASEKAYTKDDSEYFEYLDGISIKDLSIELERPFMELVKSATIGVEYTIPDKDDKLFHAVRGFISAFTLKCQGDSLLYDGPIEHVLSHKLSILIEGQWNEVHTCIFKDGSKSCEFKLTDMFTEYKDEEFVLKSDVDINSVLQFVITYVNKNRDIIAETQKFVLSDICIDRTRERNVKKIILIVTGICLLLILVTIICYIIFQRSDLIIQLRNIFSGRKKDLRIKESTVL